MSNKPKHLLVFLCLSLVAVVQASTKKGVVGYGASFLCNDFKVLNNMTWMYDWHREMSELFSKNMRKINCTESTYQQYLPEYVPMIYTLSNASGHQRFQHYTNVSTNAKYILGFNEPNRAEQANMNPREAADRWPEIERDSHGIPLVSPAPSGRNFQWLDSFFQLCKGCRVDYVAAHSYGCNADETMSFLQRLYQRHGKKIWLTEFACPYSRDRNQQLSFMKDILPKLEAADYVFRYSWFQLRIKKPLGNGFMYPEAALFRPNSSDLTPLGQFYNDFQGNGCLFVSSGLTSFLNMFSVLYLTSFSWTDF